MTIKINKRATDRKNKVWLELHGQKYPYQWSTKFGADGPNPNLVAQEFEGNFMRIPFPGKQQIVWGFETYEDLQKFKELINARYYC